MSGNVLNLVRAAGTLTVLICAMPAVVGADAPRTLNGFNLTNCFIPADQILRGGPPRDGIPALTRPKTVPAEEATYLHPDDIVVGVEIGGQARAYPLRILVWHENVNDMLDGKPIAVTYCPLCNSAVVFDRKVAGQVREFGISGLLWNSNVLLYDRPSGGKSSLWSQAAMRAVCGPAAEKGLELEALPSQMVTWEAWRKERPAATVLGRQTGYRRDYDSNPYRDYFSSQRLMFPVGASRRDLEPYPNKEQMVVIRVGEKIKGYPLSEIAAGAGTDAVLTERFNGAQIRLEYGHEEQTVGVSLKEQPPEGRHFGVAYMFWFAWKSVYPDAPVYSTGE